MEVVRDGEDGAVRAAPEQGALGDSESLESSDDEANQLPFPDADAQPESDEVSGQLHENNRKLRSMHKRLEQRKKSFQNLLKAYQRKEMEFVAQMDSHMDEVEHTEHALSLKIEALSAENHNMRSFNEKRELDNSQLAERLNETTKQCSESETRVQFLVDRIVALLSSGSADKAQTDAVVGMRQREREMLQQLQETRHSFDEVRQQNGELHSRLTEELNLSRRLQEQLVEVEERFAHFSHQRNTEGGDSSFPTGGLGHAPLSSASGLGELSMPPRGPGRLGPRPMGLRSDQTEGPPERERQPLPELPPPISEVGEANEGQTLGPVLEGEMVHSSDDEPAPNHDQQGFNEEAEEADVDELPTDPSSMPVDMANGPVFQSSSSSLEDSNPLTRVDQGARALPAIWPSTYRPSPRPGPPKPAAAEKPQYSRTTSSEAVLLMEQKLREALDRASFECAVVRIENGIYSFGPDVCAVVELTPENEVVACQQDTGDWIPVDEFIRGIAQAAQRSQGTTASTGNVAAPSASVSASWPAAASGSKASPVDNTVSSLSSSSDPTVNPSERRQFGPPAKATQPPYPTGAVSSTSPRRLTPGPVVQSGTSSSSAHPAVAPGVTLGRQAAGSTPERVRMPGQPSPSAPYGAPQAGGQRVLVAPTTQGGPGLSQGGQLRYGMNALSPRQMPSNASPVYQQGATSPRALT